MASCTLILPAPVFWVDPVQITGFTDGQALNSFLEASTRTLTLSNSTPGERPVYKTNRVNGLPTVFFAGTFNEHLDISTTITTTDTGATLVAVYQPTDAIGYATAYQSLLAGTRGCFGLGAIPAVRVNHTGLSNELVSMWSEGYHKGDSFCSATETIPNTEPTMFTFQMDSVADVGAIRINGVDQALLPFDSGDIWDGLFGYCNVLGNSSSGQMMTGWDAPLKGDLCEVMWFNSYLSAQDLKLIEDYLTGKWMG